MEKTYFDKTKLDEKLKNMDTCPNWLINAASKLGDNINAFPVKEDKNRYVVEFIYPH